MMLILTILLMFSLVVSMLGLMMLTNFSLVIFSLKFSFQYFFMDLEFMLSVWNYIFLLMVMIISMSVMVFTLSYMNGLQVMNFIYLYLSFVISMIWLISTTNFYWMMFGWDGLGVVSFLLIIFYMNQESSTNGLFTLFQNRLGDLFFVLFLLGLFSTEMQMTLYLKVGLMFLMIGSCVKSAQFPFNAWLLAAMSAPTPISSLVHSSTLVVAGVYILLQYSYCMIMYLNLILFLSLLTLIFSLLGLLNESDMKKLIAYSTMSHVGLMLFMFSVQLFKIVYFHLNIHAMFKSLMFMCFGFVMLVSFHAQDKRLVTLFNLNPIIKIIYYFSCLCLAGLPFLSAFFSKDLIIEKFLENQYNIMLIIMLLMFLGVSTYYSLKLMMLTFVMYSYSIMEKNYLGGMSVVMMLLVSILFINLFLTLVFSVTFEFVVNKLFIYLFSLCFFLLSLLTNLNYKFISYSKLMNMVEIWKVNFIMLEYYVYAHIYFVVSYLGWISEIKFFLLMNWWVMILVVMVF